MKDKKIRYTKATVGFVMQTFEEQEDGKVVCSFQEFIAGDEVTYGDVLGNPLDIDVNMDTDKEQYQPLDMVQPNPQKVRVVMAVVGGMVHDITIPSGVDVEIRDYDTDGSDSPNLKTDADGDEYHEMFWEG